MIAQFSGCSNHIYYIKNKPTLKDYKILSLYESSYTYTFMFILWIKSSNVDSVPNINRIGAKVYHLIY